MTAEERNAMAALMTAARIAKRYTETHVEQPRGPNERELHAAAEVGLRLAEMAGLDDDGYVRPAPPPDWGVRFP